ncbi:MAG TPA: hypothetical protein DEQ87_15970 [Algoriphagus sp.]|jgi:transposase InsO family protein|uniref:DDE-type integrase/transposase/recombinase n=1 Tax=unclassified Algoriphagus TaxID=2641541 RepID=UPI000C6165E4|nr:MULTISPECIES: DDE-type integrase/transposase/recombinase [unclassified Algoriphagus]MAL14701.1 hypothetical protein [Algoriphagus sp.]MAN86655.1 hypothetical protein [Algoriphagus sp.]HAH36487.1 hypothetical protein [Algoriphagus sp.]HAS61072.1 hypothetical protein [Algoriphagus sp.]HCB45682.1 hypothetical protein [Algoriphagus sp.]|tara:strand:+ start:4652 stop:5590 length:939 start_codon:yes stop_codon:yes gene_type:complete
MIHPYSFEISSACKILGYSRQSYYKVAAGKPEIEDEVIRLAELNLRKVRKTCPSQGCRSMYEEFGDQLPIGRDKSIALFMALGYRVKYPKRYGRATQSGTREFSNLLVQKDVNGVNQVWQADMAHYLYGDTKLYTIYITDVYNQEIVGYGAYDSNHALNYRAVMRKAISRAVGNGVKLKGMIHHSDGGKQYESEVYKELCNRHGILQSMCMYSYENPYAEKTNDLINSGYLNYWKPKKLEELRKCQKKAVADHNKKRRKKVLNGLSPLQYKSMLQTQPSMAYTLKLKPRNPEQPRKRVPQNINKLTVHKTEL